jgi:hypothetical protein
VTRYLLIPVRLLLGLPPIYGLTIKSHVLHVLRKRGLYKGPINFRMRAKTINVLSAEATDNGLV